MKKLVKVNNTHIMLGKPDDPDGCPIALALNEKFICNNWVVSETNCWQKPTKKILLPKKARDFVIQFDDGNSVKPFSFYIDI